MWQWLWGWTKTTECHLFVTFRRNCINRLKGHSTLVLHRLGKPEKCSYMLAVYYSVSRRRYVIFKNIKLLHVSARVTSFVHYLMKCSLLIKNLDQQLKICKYPPSLYSPSNISVWVPMKQNQTLNLCHFLCTFYKV